MLHKSEQSESSNSKVKPCNTKTILFCPDALAKVLLDFSHVSVDLNSHKCYFKQNQKSGLWELSIHENTYIAQLDRTYRNTYRNIAGGTLQSVDMLIDNLGAFHLAIETMIKNGLIHDNNRGEVLQGILNIRTIYKDRQRLMDYFDIVIVPLFDKTNVVIKSH